MANKMIKTNKTGVYYRVTKNNDKIFYITYMLNKKFTREKVGSIKEGITVQYCSSLRAKKTSIDRLKEDSPLNKKINPTFDEAARMYFKKIEGKSDTLNQIGKYELHIEPIFGDIKLENITTEMLEDYKSKARNKISPRTKRKYASSTINDWIDIVSIVYNYMKKNHNLNIQNPAEGSRLEREKVDNDRERYLELDEVKLLWDSIEERGGTQKVSYRIKLFLALSFSTGARLGSVMTISKADINLLQDSILIKNHKSNRTYNGFLHPKYKELIKERMKELKPNEYIVSGNTKVMGRSTISRNIKPLLDIFNEGIDEGDAKRRVVIHTFRHTFASLLAIQGTPIYTIMRLLDHADISQTIRYAKLSPDSTKENVMKLDF